MAICVAIVYCRSTIFIVSEKACDDRYSSYASYSMAMETFVFDSAVTIVDVKNSCVTYCVIIASSEPCVFVGPIVSLYNAT